MDRGKGLPSITSEDPKIFVGAGRPASTQASAAAAVPEAIHPFSEQPREVVLADPATSTLPPRAAPSSSLQEGRKPVAASASTPLGTISALPRPNSAARTARAVSETVASTQGRPMTMWKTRSHAATGDGIIIADDAAAAEASAVAADVV